MRHPPIGMLTGKVAVITGAGGGIGRVVAQVFAREGAKVVLADISGQEREVAELIGAAALPLTVDASDEAQVTALFETTVQTFGRVDASVHLAAALGGRQPGAEVTLEEFDRMTGAPLRATLLSTKHAGLAMAATGGGAIVNFSSVASLNADAMIPFGYSAAKAAVNALTKSFALEFGPMAVRVNAIAPGFTMTGKNQGMANAFMAMFNAKAALGRGCDPEEQAQVAAFLCSDRASFVSGAIIPVDGGWSARLA